MEEHALVKDESCWPIKRHLTGDGCRGNQPPESVSAVITEPTYSAVWSFLASLLNFDNDIESCWCPARLSVCVYFCEGAFEMCKNNKCVCVCNVCFCFVWEKHLLDLPVIPVKGIWTGRVSDIMQQGM